MSLAPGEVTGVAPVPVVAVPVIDLCTDGAEPPPAEAPAPPAPPAAELATAAELPPVEAAAQFIGKDVAWFQVHVDHVEFTFQSKLIIELISKGKQRSTRCELF